MEPTTIAIGVAVGAMILAGIIGAARYLRGQGSTQSYVDTASGQAAVGSMAAPAFTKPRPASANLVKNKRGWSAPSSRYYFNDAGEIYDTITGSWILDMLVIAELCGIMDYVPSVEDGYTAEECAEYEHEAAADIQDEPIMGSGIIAEEPVGTETIASHPEPVPVSAPMPEPVKEAFTAPEPYVVHTPDPDPVKESYGGSMGDSGGGSSDYGNDFGDDDGGGDD